MDQAKNQRVKEIFLAARKQRPGERAAFLDEACGGDAELRAEVESLLKHDEAETAAVLKTAGGEQEANCAASMVGTKVGRFHIKRVIASGGMGTVFEAVQEHPRRNVALKVMKQGIASRSALRRFEYESQILARLRHPGIAQVYEAGTHDDGSGPVPYFAMEYIPSARTIIEYAEFKKLGTRGRLELFAQVCEAVQHGHGKGIIHRDLKPANILVDSSGQPKVIDFGVARATDSDLAVTTLQTDVGQLIGTLQYMSPEQCDADPHDLDTRSDVYALGVLLYELLCGRLPYDVSRAAVYEAARVIREEVPARPSTINRTLRGDVETITLKALEKDRERRYTSATDLGKDIKRYLNSEPIEARPPSLRYQVGMFARRNRAIFVAAASLVVALTIATIALAVALALTLNANAETNIALDAKNAALVEKDAALVEKERALVEKDAERAAAEAARNKAEWKAYLANIRATYIYTPADVFRKLRAILDACPPHLRNWEWDYLNAHLDQSLAVLRGHAGPVLSASFSPDGMRIVTGSNDNTARVWDAATGDELVVLRGHRSAVRAASFSPDGTRIVTGSYDNTARVWDAATGDELVVLRGHEDINSASFSPDGKRIVTAERDGTTRVWDAVTGDELADQNIDPGLFMSASFSPDGTRIVTSGSMLASVWDATLEDVIYKVYTDKHGGFTSASFSPDGKRIVTSFLGGVARVWDVSDYELYCEAESDDDITIAILRGHTGNVYSASYSPDGTRIITASEDHTARVWDAETGDELAVLRGHKDRLMSASFSPDGKRIVTASWDGTARVWHATTEDGDKVLTLPAPLDFESFSPDGTRYVTTSGDTTARVWDAETGDEVVVIRGHAGPVWSASFSPNGKRIVTAERDGTARVWDAATGDEVVVLREHAGPVQSASFSPSGTRIVTASEDTTARVWDAETGDEVVVLRGHAGPVRSASFSPNGTRIVTASEDTTARVWDAETGDEVVVLRAHAGPVQSASFSPDGTRIVTISRDTTMHVTDAATGNEKVIRRGHAGSVRGSGSFTPSGMMIVTGSNDNTARVWDAATGDELVVLRGHTDPIRSTSFSPDGTRIVTVSDDKTAHVWDAATGDELAVLRGHEDIKSASFSPDGTRIITRSVDKQNTVRVWDSVPYRDRYAERLRTGPHGTEATALLDRLHAQYGDWTRVANTIRSDLAMTDDLRRVALDLLTVRAENDRRAGVQ